MTDTMFWAFILIPMLATLWAFTALADLVAKSRELGVPHAESLLPADRRAMERYVNNPIAGMLASPRQILATFRFIATPQQVLAIEELRKRYLLRLVGVAVTWIATLTALVVLTNR